MTNAEAIKIINQYDCNFYWTDGEKIPTEDLIEAFDMAVKALKAQKMRLIDADEIMKALSIFNDIENGNSHFLNGIETAKELIESAHTIATIHVIDERTGKEDDPREIVLKEDKVKIQKDVEENDDE